MQIDNRGYAKMGLDQYAYVTAKSGDHDAFYDQDGLEMVDGEWVVPSGGMQKPREIAYWRKHPNLQGWMEKLWISKGMPSVHGSGNIFNNIELELTFDDIIKLENDINNDKMSELGTKGFFFGDPSDEYYKERDLEFIKQAKAELFCGLKVFYNSSW